MKLQLRRLYRKDKYTIGKLYIDCVYFCDVIEDKDRSLTQDMPLSKIKQIKVYAETAIPYGTYKVKMTYSPKFKRVLPLVCAVPGYEGIRIHAGSSEKSSAGCLIVGFNTIVGKVTNSKATLEKLIAKLTGQKDIIIDITK